MSFQEFSSFLPEKADGLTAILTGVRTQESFRRLKAVSSKKNDNYIARDGHVAHCHPIYDWSSEDVWLAVQLKVAEFDRGVEVIRKIFPGSNSNNLKKYQEIKENRTNKIED